MRHRRAEQSWQFFDRFQLSTTQRSQAPLGIMVVKSMQHWEEICPETEPLQQVSEKGNGPLQDNGAQGFRVTNSNEAYIQPIDENESSK